jgi:hypothetical protein
MSGIESVCECAGFGSAHLTNNDSVRSVPENCFQQVTKCDWPLVCIELGFDGDDMRFSDGELCRVFDDQNAVFVGDGIGKDVYERCLARAGSTGYQDIVATTNGFLEPGRRLWRDGLTVYVSTTTDTAVLGAMSSDKPLPLQLSSSKPTPFPDPW